MSEATAPTDTSRQIRGSSLLVAGRLLALAINLATQVLIVRALSKGDYGAFAFGLALVSTARTVVSLGHHQVYTRFFSLYDEREEHGKFLGTIVMEILTIVCAAAFLFVALIAARDVLTGSVVDDDAAMGVLLILVLLAPLEALERIFESLLAVFSRPRAIFARKYVLTPGLRFACVLALLALDSSVELLAVGYVVTGAAGVALYVALVWRIFREGHLLARMRAARMQMPFREVFGFAFPLLTGELLYISMTAGSVVLLGYHGTGEDVAQYRAVYPAAHLNVMVLFTFALLFTPLATRMYARGDREGMRVAYWQTAAWLAVLSFPIFAVTAPFAAATTHTLFGARYEDSAAVLAVLSCGYYFSAALGFNALTLQTYGALGYVVRVNVIAAVVNLVLALVLIPRHGAIGVAVANGVTLVVQNVLMQAGLARRVGVPALDPRSLRTYGVIAAAAGLLVAAQAALDPPFVIAVALAAAASGGVLLATRSTLDLERTFPEVLRVPGMRRLLGS